MGLHPLCLPLIVEVADLQNGAAEQQQVGLAAVVVINYAYIILKAKFPAVL